MTQGFDIQSVNYLMGNQVPQNLPSTRALFQDYIALGINTVHIGWRVPIDDNTGKIISSFPAYSVFPTMRTTSNEEITAVTDLAHSLGLKVVLKPQAQTTLTAAPDNVSMNSIHNGTFDPATFLAQWAGYMAGVATLARQTKAEMVVIGTENNGFDVAKYLPQWTSLIEGIRGNYGGLLTYDAMGVVGRSYGYGVDMVPFWGLLDMISVSAYFPLTDAANPTYADALKGWFANRISANDTISALVNVPAALVAVAAKYGKPLYFGEFGSQSFDGLLRDPSGAGPAFKVPDAGEQALLYESMFAAMANTAPGVFKGINIWGVYNGTPAIGASHFADFAEKYLPTEFDIRTKAAAAVVHDWFTGIAQAAGGPNAVVLGTAGNHDRVAFLGRSDQYKLGFVESGNWTVTDVATGRASTSTLRDVERINFSDKNVALDVQGNAGMAYRLYQAAFSRTPDQGGLGYQMKALDDGLNISQVAANFIASPEFSAAYGALDNDKFVIQLYQNVLHRAPDPAGLTFHTDNLSTGANTRANVLVGFSESPENQVALIGTIQGGMFYTV